MTKTISLKALRYALSSFKSAVETGINYILQGA